MYIQLYITHAACTDSLSIADDLEKAEEQSEKAKKELETTLAELGDI